MSGGASLSVKNFVAANLFGDSFVTGGPIPSVFYLALSTSEPTNSTGPITNVTATDYGSYARVAVDNDDLSWTITDGVVENVAAIEFPEATADGTDAVGWVVAYTALTGGTAVFWGDLAAPLDVVSYNIPRLAAGTVTFNVS